MNIFFSHAISRLFKELQTKRETIKRYEQELQSMKQLLEITVKEKQIQSDQIKHERQCKSFSHSLHHFFIVLFKYFNRKMIH